MSEALANVPRRVQVSVSWALRTITEWNGSVTTARSMERLAGCPGRYEWELRYAPEYAELRGLLQQALARLQEFEGLARAHHVNVQAVYAQLGSFVHPYPEGPHVRAFRPTPEEEPLWKSSTS